MKKLILPLLAVAFINPTSTFANDNGLPVFPYINIGDSNLKVAVPAAKKIVERLHAGDGTTFCARELGASMRILADLENRVISMVPATRANPNKQAEHPGFIESSKFFEVQKDMLEALQRYGIQGMELANEAYVMSFASPNQGTVLRTSVFLFFTSDGQDSVLVLNDEINHTYFVGAKSYCTK